MVDIQNETAPEVQGTTRADTRQVLDFHDKDTKNIEISKIDEAEVGTILRLGDKYFQIVRTPDGNVTTVYREKAELKADGTDFSKVQKYIGSYVEHNFLNYRQSLNGWWNLSHPLKWQAKEGEFPTIRRLFQHIFGEQIELGFDRYQLLLTRPHQIQPILVCVSEEQGTGKSTLLQLDGMLFGSNAIILNVSQYSQQFNALYATKLCIGIDETFINALNENCKELVYINAEGKVEKEKGALQCYEHQIGKLAIIDLKTSSSVQNVLALIQLNGYKLSTEQNGLGEVALLFILHLSKDGKYKLICYETDPSLFMSCLTLHKALLKKKRLKKENAKNEEKSNWLGNEW